MRPAQKGSMNIQFSEKYDQEDDTYYVTFKTGEPSYCIEVDDVILLELGVFSKLPTGFRLLNFKKNKVASVKIQILIKKVKETISKTSPPAIDRREAVVEKALAKVLGC
jgi:hypothetical protein